MIIAVNGHDLRAGRLTGVDADELRKVLGAGDVTATLRWGQALAPVPRSITPPA